MKNGIEPKSWEAVHQTGNIIRVADVEGGAVILVGEGKDISIWLWIRAHDLVIATDGCGAHHPQKSQDDYKSWKVNK